MGRVLTIWIITDHDSSFSSHFYLCQVQYRGMHITIFGANTLCPPSVCVSSLSGVREYDLVSFWLKPNQKNPQKRLALGVHIMHSSCIFSTWNKSRYHGKYIVCDVRTPQWTVTSYRSYLSSFHISVIIGVVNFSYSKYKSACVCSSMHIPVRKVFKLYIG